MNKDIKAIFIDIDWTILSHKKRPPKWDKRSIRYLTKLQKEGIKIIVNTARPYISYLDIGLNKLIKPDGLILSSGSLAIIDDIVIHEERMRSEDFETLSMIALKYDGNLEGIRTYDSFLIRKMNDPVKYVFMAYPSRIPNVEGIHRKKVNKATLYFKKELYEDIIKEIPKHLHIFRFHDNALDISPRSINKGMTLKRVVEYLHLNKDQCIAIGDEISDTYMFNEVTYSIAMGNASEEVKEKAKIITRDVNHHGVKFALKYLIK